MDKPMARRQRRPEARPDEILDAAMAVFAEAGFAGARVEDIAARAGLSKGAVYVYFDSKHAMLTALVRRLADRVVGAAEALVDAGAAADAEKTLRTLITFIAVQVSDPQVSAAPRLIIAEAQRFPEIGALYRDVVLARVRRLIARLCALGRAQGTFRAVEPEVLLRMCGGPMVAQMMLTTVFADPAQPGPSPETIANGIADMVLNGLKVRQEIAA
jgi:AcrR family transcriptional regulator